MFRGFVLKSTSCMFCGGGVVVCGGGVVGCGGGVVVCGGGRSVEVVLLGLQELLKR